MGLKTAVALLLFVVGLAGPATAVPVYNPATGHWYDTTVAGDWPTAEAAAVLLGGHLVTINDAAENAWLLATYGSSHSRAWTGFNDIAVEGSWGWVSGEAVTYTNWASGEPNDWPPDVPANENWGEIYFTINTPGTWNDCILGCGGTSPPVGIAEWSPRPPTPGVPSPASLLLLGLGLGLAGLAGLRHLRG